MKRCADCEKELGETSAPWAFPLLDMRFDEGLRFCSEQCLNAYEVEHAPAQAPSVAKETK